jgi:hypothetical protein
MHGLKANDAHSARGKAARGNGILQFICSALQPFPCAFGGKVVVNLRPFHSWKIKCSERGRIR